MKKNFIILFVFCLIAVSCEKEPNNQPPEPEDKIPSVSISADEYFNSENISKLTVKLSAVSDKGTVVNLIETDVQSGKSKLPVDFEKKITIPAGGTETTIDVVAKVQDIETGDYQAAIKIESADNATFSEEGIVYINYQEKVGAHFANLEIEEVLASDDFEDKEAWINFDQDQFNTSLSNALGGTQEYYWSNTWGGACVHAGKSAINGANCLQLHWGGTVSLQGFEIAPDKIYQLEVMVHPLGGISGEWNNWGAVHLFVFNNSNVWQSQGVRVRLSNNDASGGSPALLALDVWEGEEGIERPINLFEFSDKWQEYAIDDANDGTPSFWVPLKLVFQGGGTEANPLVIDFYLNDKFIKTESFDNLFWLGDKMIGIQNGADNSDVCRYDNFKLSVMREANNSNN